LGEGSCCFPFFGVSSPSRRASTSRENFRLIRLGSVEPQKVWHTSTVKDVAARSK
jgi:hypothetical protein